MADLTSKELLEAALTPATVVTIYDDNKDGVADDTPLAANIKRASAQVRSYLPGHYNPTGAGVADDELLQAAATDFLVAYSFERHPEYVRTFGEEKRAERWKRAEAMCERIKSGVQRPVRVEEVQGVSKTVGGYVVETGPRMGTEDMA